MKIAFVLDDTIDTNDGVQQYVKMLGLWLRENGHDVDYIVGSSQPSQHTHSMSKNIRVKFNGNTLSVPLPAGSRQITELLDKNQYDILHVQMPHSPFMANKCIKLAPRSTAIVGTFHVAPYGRLANKGAQLAYLMVQKQITRITTVIAVSDVAAHFANKTYKINCQVIPNAVDLSSLKPPRQSARSYDIAFVGRLVARKGCEYLLKAVKEIVDNDPSRKLSVAIAGDGVLKDKLVAYVNKHNLNQYVKFMGYVSEQEKKKLLQTARLAVFPATGGESFGIVLIEAMAAGAVTMGGDNPGYQTVLGSKSSLFNPRDTVKLAKNITDFLDNPALYNSEHSRQQKRVMQFDINNVGNAILKVYKEAIKHNGR